MNVDRGPLEIWGGIECTINRVADRFADQLERSGHYGRLADIDRLVGLGFRKIRYPALWERTAPAGIAAADWSWLDVVLPRLRDAGVEPIVGLVHHGSGPASTNLLDPAFGDKLAEYAAAFACRYPWVKYYTPINEPLTTARFSGLYGHWYPHCRDDRSFLTALVNQLRGTVLAMEAVRAVAPDAQLVQTEDAGAVANTAPLAPQAEFENHRRWLSLDLLVGRVDADHPMVPYLRRAGIGRDVLDWFGDHATPPDIVGLNYYVTSDRYLDHRCERHPAWTHGGNGRQRYADVEAARVEGQGIRGHQAVLLEAWQRYRLPLAITEVHIGCTREEQMRWLVDAWRGALDARAAGADVVAITAWALLGSFDWDSLVTRDAGHYEPGVFDVRAPDPRPTALARVVRDLAQNREPEHPVLATPGWWHRVNRRDAAPGARRPILIAGATGTLGRAFAQACTARGLDYRLLTRRDLDITNPESVNAAVAAHRPWAIVNAAGYVRVDEAERDVAACRRVNAIGPMLLAAACRRARIRLVTFSSDLVFDGAATSPYLESHLVRPLNVYGWTKVEAERRVLAIEPDALVVRTSAFFGPHDEYNFVSMTLRALRARQPVRAASDAIVSPTYVPDLVDATLDLLIDGASGIWHLANDGAVSWAELALAAARLYGLDPELIDPCPVCTLGAAQRPSYSALGSERGQLMPPLDHSLARYVRERERLGTAA